MPLYDALGQPPGTFRTPQPPGNPATVRSPQEQVTRVPDAHPPGSLRGNAPSISTEPPRPSPQSPLIAPDLHRRIRSHLDLRR
jgi:hypothetical protein